MSERKWISGMAATFAVVVAAGCGDPAPAARMVEDWDRVDWYGIWRSVTVGPPGACGGTRDNMSDGSIDYTWRIFVRDDVVETLTGERGGPLEQREIAHLDADGNPVDFTIDENDDGVVDYGYTYTYDEQGRLLTASGLGSTPPVGEVYTYTGDRGTRDQLNRDGTVRQHRDLVYNADGRRLRQTIDGLFGEPVDGTPEEIYEFTWANDRPVDIAISYEGGKPARVVYRYDEAGRPLGTETFDVEGKPFSRYVKTYDAQGRLIRRQNFAHPLQDAFNNETIEYQYDCPPM